MKRYTAGDPTTDGAGPETREWVFGALATPGYRERCEQLAELDLRRRPGCEPCLQSLVTDEWTAETQHHLGWCDSCRAAAIALGPGVRAEGAARRRWPLWLAVAAGVVILVPLAGSRLIDDPLTSQEVRGGAAHEVGSPSVVPVPRSKAGGVTSTAGGATAVGVKASAGHKTTAGAKSSSGSRAAVGAKAAASSKASAGGKVVVVARHKTTPAAGSGQRVLPLTT